MSKQLIKSSCIGVTHSITYRDLARAPIFEGDRHGVRVLEETEIDRYLCGHRPQAVRVESARAEGETDRRYTQEQASADVRPRKRQQKRHGARQQERRGRRFRRRGGKRTVSRRQDKEAEQRQRLIWRGEMRRGVTLTVI